VSTTPRIFAKEHTHVTEYSAIDFHSFDRPTVNRLGVIMPTPPKNTSQPSRTVVLKLSSTLLSRFPHESPAVDEKDVQIKDASSPPSSTSGEAGLQASSFDNASDAASTPAPAAAEGGKAKKSNGAGSARGTKRALDKTGDAPKPRSRPSAARKKLKLYALHFIGTVYTC
jgi:hypothetical protein